MTTEKIVFRQTRDFGQKLNATFEFIKQNFKPLVGAIFRVMWMPLLLVAVIYGGIYFGLWNLTQGDFSDPSMIVWIVLGAIAGGFLMVIYLALYYGVIYEYIKAYMGSELGQVSVSEVTSAVRNNLGSHVTTILAMIGIMVVLSIVPLVAMVLMFEDQPVIGVFMMFAFMGVLFYIYVCLSLFIVIRVHEKLSIRDSISRSFEIIKGKWWSTFGLILVCGLIQGFMSYLVFIPYYIIIFVMGFSGGFEIFLQDPSLEGTAAGFIAISIIFYTLYIIVALIMSCLTYIAIAFQYYNLVELKEARGLMDKIENFASADEDEAEHY